VSAQNQEAVEAVRGKQALMTSENAGKSSEAQSTALYIASLAEELARLAKRHEFDSLAYILDMARLEADQISKRWSAPTDHERQPS
jgi:hypothetical protein